MFQEIMYRAAREHQRSKGPLVVELTMRLFDSHGSLDSSLTDMPEAEVNNDCYFHDALLVLAIVSAWCIDAFDHRLQARQCPFIAHDIDLVLYIDAIRHVGAIHISIASS